MRKIYADAIVTVLLPVKMKAKVIARGDAIPLGTASARIIEDISFEEILEIGGVKGTDNRDGILDMLDDALADTDQLDIKIESYEVTDSK